MILNHKDAIEFLVSAADEIGFNRYTILNLHALLANNLLADPTAAGRLRYIAVGIERSAFHPLEVPQLIRGKFRSDPGDRGGDHRSLRASVLRRWCSFPTCSPSTT